MRELTELQACYERLRALGYDKTAAERLAKWCMDDSQPAPAWTHPENQ